MSIQPGPAMLDVGVGAVVTGGRAGLAAGRLALRPAAWALSVPVPGRPLERVAGVLARDGQDAVTDGRSRGERLAQEALTAPEVQRIATRMLAEADLDRLADRIL